MKMENGVTCDHLNKLADVLEKELWQSKEVIEIIFLIPNLKCNVTGN